MGGPGDPDPLGPPHRSLAAPAPDWSWTKPRSRRRNTWMASSCCAAPTRPSPPPTCHPLQGTPRRRTLLARSQTGHRHPTGLPQQGTTGDPAPHHRIGTTPNDHHRHLPWSAATSRPPWTDRLSNSGVTAAAAPDADQVGRAVLHGSAGSRQWARRPWAWRAGTPGPPRGLRVVPFTLVNQCRSISAVTAMPASAPSRCGTIPLRR